MSIEKLLVPLICLFAGKVIFLHGTFSEALALAIFSACVLVKEHYDTHKQVKEYKKSLEDMRKEFEAKLAETQKDVDVLKTSITSVKLAQGLRGMNGKPQN